MGAKGWDVTAGTASAQLFIDRGVVVLRVVEGEDREFGHFSDVAEEHCTVPELLERLGIAQHEPATGAQP